MNYKYKPGLIAFVCNDITDFNGMNNEEYYPITKLSDLVGKRFTDVIKDVFYVGNDDLYNTVKEYCIESYSYYKSQFTIEEELEIIEKQIKDLNKIKKQLKQKLNKTC
jgi:hypothetical protein